jgi:hypothetical protein
LVAIDVVTVVRLGWTSWEATPPKENENNSWAVSKLFEAGFAVKRR